MESIAVRTRFLFFRACCAALMTVPGLACALDAESVQDSIDEFHSGLISVMRLDTNYDTRYATLEPLIRRVFDGPNIARISTGKTWRTLEPGAQEAFAELMFELITATYASRFESYNDQVFQIESTESKGKDRWVVKSSLTKANGESVRLDYYLKSGAVFNVVANGVSDLSLKRADYSSIISQKGFSGLVDLINDNIEEYRTSAAQ